MFLPQKARDTAVRSFCILCDRWSLLDAEVLCMRMQQIFITQFSDVSDLHGGDPRVNCVPITSFFTRISGGLLERPTVAAED